MTSDQFFVWAFLDGSAAGCGDGHEAFEALLRAKGEIVAVNWTDEFAEFRRLEPDTQKTFTIADLERFTGLTRAGVNFWITHGVCEPDVGPRRGRGHERRWSYQAAFVARSLAGMAKRGVPLGVLAAISRDFTRAGTKRKVLV